MSQAVADRPLLPTELAGAAEASGTPDARTAPARRRSPGLVDPGAAARLVRGDLSAGARSRRHLFCRLLARLVLYPWFRVRVEGADRFATGPVIYAFNHLSWLDPLLLLATFPTQPRLVFFGPKERTLQVGARNRFLWWTGVTIPFSPTKDDLRTSLRHAEAQFDTGGAIAIAPEGTIHVHEGDLLPLEEGAAYLALRAGVPVVPVAITGTSWARFRSEIVVRIGEPIEVDGRPTKESIARLSSATWHALRAMVADDVDAPPPSRFERWLTDLFNDWGDGGRAAATRRRGPDPAAVPRFDRGQLSR